VPAGKPSLRGGVRRAPNDKPCHSVISGENYHALQLLAYTHAGKVDVIYIDPPYNTGDKSWKYNNRFVDSNDSYRHSKWLAMMERRLKLAKKLLKPTGVLIVTIDEHEVFYLGVLIDRLYPRSNIQMLTIVINPKGIARRGFARVEEYAICVLPKEGEDPVRQQPVDLLRDRDLEPEDVTGIWISLLRRGTNALPSDSPTLTYPIAIDAYNRICGTGPSLKDMIRLGEVSPSDMDSWQPRSYVGKDKRWLWPLRRDGSLGTWRISGRKLMELSQAGQARVSRFEPSTGRGVVHYVSTKARNLLAVGDLQVAGRDQDGSLVLVPSAVAKKTPSKVWHRSSHDAGIYGSNVITQFLAKARPFDFPKAIYSTADTLRTVVSENPDAVILDFFAGSGTTLHSVALLNAQDGGRRQCILVTNNDLGDAEAKKANDDGDFSGDPEFEERGIFESVTMPRVKAAITGTRPDGQPVEGSYLASYLPDHDYADGFEENVAFFRMEYLEPDLVELGRQYEAIAPLLWMAAGSVGEWEPWDGASPWSAPEASSYAVLFDESKMTDLVACVAARNSEQEDGLQRISHVWIVTDSHSGFVELRASLPDDVNVGQLYREYLRNFAVNGPGSDL